MSINILSESNFDSIVGTKPALVDFGAEWCVYCKKIASPRNSASTACRPCCS